MFCNEEVFAGLARIAEAVTSLGGLPSVWVQQVNGDGLGCGEPKDTKRGIAFPAPRGSHKLVSHRALRT